MDEVARVSDVELIVRLERLVKADRALSAKLLVHLGEVEARGLHRERAFGSMFEYCTSGLGMSEAEAYLRLHAARVGRKFPVVVERLGAGGLSLSAIKLLSPHLTAENHVQLLDRVRDMSKRKIEAFVAELAPKPDVPARMRKLPQARGFNKSNTPNPIKAAPTSIETSNAASCNATSSPTRNAASASAGARSPMLTPVESTNAATNAVSCSAALTSVESCSAATSAASCGAALTPRESHDAEASAASCGTALEAEVSAITMTPLAAAGSSRTTQPSAAHDVTKATFALESPRRRATLKPLSPGRFELRLTVGQETRDALRQLVELLRHQNPGGDMTCIVERALCELLKREMKRRFGQSDAKHSQEKSVPAPAARPSDTRDKPAAKLSERKAERVDAESKGKRMGTHAPKSRYIPVGVRREVHTRDNGQCTFVGPDGRRCTERGFLEIHHHNTTFARGGAATTDNLRLACRAHNQFYAEQDYGREHMQAKLREATARNQLR